MPSRESNDREMRWSPVFADINKLASYHHAGGQPPSRVVPQGALAWVNKDTTARRCISVACTHRWCQCAHHFFLSGANEPATSALIAVPHVPATSIPFTVTLEMSGLLLTLIAPHPQPGQHIASGTVSRVTTSPSRRALGSQRPPLSPTPCCLMAAPIHHALRYA